MRDDDHFNGITIFIWNLNDSGVGDLLVGEDLVLWVVDSDLRVVNDDFLLDGFNKVFFFGNRVDFGNFFIFDNFLDSLNDFIDWDNLLSDGIINNRL